MAGAVATRGSRRRSSTALAWKRWLAVSAVITHGAIFGVPANAANGDLDGCDGDTGALNLACGEFSHAFGSSETFTAATAVGVSSDAAATSSSAFGYGSKATGHQATSLGAQATAGHANAIAVGQGVSTTRDNQVKIGQDTNTYTLSGINGQQSKNTQSGTKYLVTSDAAGNLATASVNIDEIEGLADDVAAHTTQIASLNTTVGNHTTQIANHETRITDNTSQIASLNMTVGSQTTQLADHETRITDNTNQIGTLNTTVGNHTTELADHETRITGNTSTLNLHTTQISSLDSRTTVNETNIALLDGRVGVLEGGLQDLGEQVSENRSEARAGTALALATAGLRYDDRPGKLSLAGGFGHFKGQSGLALGLGYSTSEDFRLNAAVSASTSRGDVGVSVGASWTLN